MKGFEPRTRVEQFLARFERGLLLVIGFFIVLLLTIALFTGASGKANAAGYNSWPYSKGIAHCWASLFEQYGANMLAVTQTVSADSASVKYRISLQGGEEKVLVCHSASGKVTETEQER
jgi:hypothetical protein